MIRNLFIATLLALGAVSCSDIKESDRFITIEGVTAERVVLLEDFTGQNCVNCPAAHQEIDALVKQYGDALVPVAIHAGSFGIPSTNRRPGLMQPEGQTYNDRYGIDEYPKGVINGRSGALNPGEWSDFLREELQVPAELDIDLSATISADEPGKIAVECILRPDANMQGTLQLWVLEDGIVARQLDKDGNLIPDYVHNHVYRAAVNGVDGENVTLQANTHKTLAYTVGIRNTDKEAWAPENLSIVAFLRQADGGVAQAAKCHVVTGDVEEE